jgi:hypothetical protein
MSLEHFYIEQQSLDFVASVGDTCTSLLTIVNCTNFPLTLMGSVDEPFYFNWGGGLVTSGTFDVYDKFYVMLAISFIATTPGQYNSKATFRSALDGTVIEIPVSAYVFPDVNPQQDAVDLGLPSGTLWATCNVGATAPEEYGDYFAWAETVPNKDFYQWSTTPYVVIEDGQVHFTKYNTKESLGPVDNKTELDPEDDAAYVNWGEEWRMPSKEQIDELSANCTWVWTQVNGVNGQLATGPNGNTIFFPAAGSRLEYDLSGAGERGHYWTRSLYILTPTVTFPNSGYKLYVTNNTFGWNSGNRNCGFVVRAVRAN